MYSVNTHSSFTTLFHRFIPSSFRQRSPSSAPTTTAHRTLTGVCAGLVFGLSSAFAWAAKPAPIYGLDDPNRIPDQYLIVLKPSLGPNAASALEADISAQGFSADKRFKRALQGFKIKATGPGSAQGNAKARLDALAKNPNVAFIEADRWVTLGQTSPSGNVQNPAIWGLDRIDQRDLPLDQKYHYDLTAPQVHAYVVDSGIRATHSEFSGRVRGGQDLTGSGSALEDCSGHGTHVAGTIGSAAYGVAKGVNLWSVRVFDCTPSSPWSRIIEALEWIIANHQSPAVVNMSLSGGIFYAANEAVENAVTAGITVVVAAGNDYSDACWMSPASATSAIAVGATRAMDDRSIFSNYGTCVDLFAPGDGVLAPVHTSDYATEYKSGTSMASPHVAGAVALYLQQHPTATPAEVTQAIIGNATLNKVVDAGEGSPNRLLYVPTNDFSANFPHLFLRGNLNNWGTTPLALVANNIWEVTITQPDTPAKDIKFDVYGDWTQNYGDSNNDGQVELFGGNITLPCGGTYRIQFNDLNLSYSITAIENCQTSTWKRTIIFIEGATQTNQDLFIRGGIDHAYAAQLGIQCTPENKLCAVPIRHLNLRNATTAPWKQGDAYLDWYGAEPAQVGAAQGSPLDWTTNFWPSSWGTPRYVTVDGYGQTPLNLWGDHYWMLDVEMDCSRTQNGWFEFKSFITNGPGWEGDIHQQQTPYQSNNHFAQCGRISSFRRNQNNPVWVGDF